MEDKYFESTIAALLSNHHEFTAVNLNGYNLQGGTQVTLHYLLDGSFHNLHSLLSVFLPLKKIEYTDLRTLCSIIRGVRCH